MCTILECSVTDIIQAVRHRDRIKSGAILERATIDAEYFVKKSHVDSRQPDTIFESAITYLVNQIVIVVIRNKDVT